MLALSGSRSPHTPSSSVGFFVPCSSCSCVDSPDASPQSFEASPLPRAERRPRSTSVSESLCDGVSFLADWLGFENPRLGHSWSNRCQPSSASATSSSSDGDETTPLAMTHLYTTSTDASLEVGHQRSYERWKPGVIARNLQQAQHDARRLRWRVSGPPLFLGLTVFTVAVAVMIINLEFFSPRLFCVSSVCAVLGASLQLLALFPTDTWAVYAGAIAWCLGSVPLCAVFGWATLAFTRAPSAHVDAEYSLAYGFSCALVFTYQASFLVRLSASAITLSTRALLLREWRYLTEFCLVWGIAHLVWGGVDFAASYRGPRCTLAAVLVQIGMSTAFQHEASLDMAPGSLAELAAWWPSLLPSGLLIVGFGVVLAPRTFPYMPRRLHSFLVNLGDEISRAASIAAAVGGRDIALVMSDARERCRIVPLDRVTKERMSSNAPATGATLAGCAEPARIGEIDAFVSHSWHDDSESKWEALQSWRESFKVKHGREPHCWIDKYCIDQSNIAADLMCLPIYLAGSRSLLVLLGRTYLQRLWCILEISVFIIMGGPVDAISLRRVTADGECTQDLRETIRNFCVKRATCSKNEDKDMLFSVVEAGFGDLDEFDQAVRRLLGDIERAAPL